VVTIAHISDPHVGSPYFVPNLMNRVIAELNELAPDVVVCTGDLTNEGYRQEYKNWVADVKGVRIVGADSSEPDLNEGQIGRERYPWIREQFAVPADLKIFAIHHHLIPVPGTGRERSTVMDAGDLLEVLITSGVNIVLSGHKHVPYVWHLENMYIANAGTVSSLRLRGYTKPCYNVLEFEGDEVKIHRRFPFGGSNVIAHFSLTTGAQYHRELEPPVQERGVPVGE
jgi:Icc protein